MRSADGNGQSGDARIIESQAQYNAQQATYEMKLTQEKKYKWVRVMCDTVGEVLKEQEQQSGKYG